MSRLPAPDLPRLRAHPRDAAFVRAVLVAAAAGLPDPRFGVDALAAAVGKSPRQLTRRLKALTGETPGALLQRLRLARAARLLADGHTVVRVTGAVGLASRSQFSRLFREVYGVPPSAYATESSPGVAPVSEMGTGMSGSGT